MYKNITILVATFSLLISIPLHTAHAASDPACLSTYYQNKEKECLDQLVKLLQSDQSQKHDGKIGDTTKIQPLIGMMAEILRSSPDKKADLLPQDAPPYNSGVYVEVLYRAGFPMEGRSYADTNGIAPLAAHYEKNNLQPITLLIPHSWPGDNDLLIGAYSTSGDKNYIKQILKNFETAEDSRISDAFRMSFMKGKFGSSLAYKDRDTTMAKSWCEKYHCETDMKDALRTMTLTSAMWALSSLAKSDEGIKATLQDFFDKSPKIKQLYLTEQNAFSNYLTLLAMSAALPNNEEINNTLQAYERFEVVDWKEAVKSVPQK